MKNKRGFAGILILIIIILTLIGSIFIYLKIKATLSSLPLSPFKDKEEAESGANQLINNTEQPTIEEINAPDNINLSYNNSFKA